MTPRRHADPRAIAPWATPWDRALAGRTSAVWLLATGLAIAVLVATDEREATWQARLARLCALSPALAALSTALVAARLEQSGDLRALAAMGVSRYRALRGSILSATAVGLTAALALVVGLGSLDGLFPPLSGEIWRRTDPGFAAPGVVLEGVDGAVRFVALGATETVRSFRTEVAATVALFAIALPAWMAHPERRLVRGVVGSAIVVAAIVCFHAVSAGRSPALLFAPPFALLAYLGTLALRSRAHGLRTPS